jgi:hypothetical protein
VHADQHLHDELKERLGSDDLDRHHLLLPERKLAVLKLDGRRAHGRAVRVWLELRQRGGYLPYIEEEKMG